jgi:hypothetical protein
MSTVTSGRSRAFSTRRNRSERFGPRARRRSGRGAGARLDQPSPAGQLSLFAPAPSGRSPRGRRDHPAELRRARDPRWRPCRSRGGRGARLQPLQSGLLHQEACDSTRRRSTLEPREAPVRCREVDSEIAKGSSRRSERVWIEKAFLASSVRRSVRTASDRGQLTMACGTGKTLVGLLVAEARTHAHACPRTLALATCPDAARVDRETPSAPSLPRGLLG